MRSGGGRVPGRRGALVVQMTVALAAAGAALYAARQARHTARVAIHMRWRRVRLQVHPSEPGLTHLALYISHDAEKWSFIGCDVASMATHKDLVDGVGCRAPYLPALVERVLRPGERYIGLVAERWTRTQVELLGSDGLLNVPEITRPGVELPLSDFASGPYAALVFWDVSGTHGWNSYGARDWHGGRDDS